jgi:uncharacterized protein YkwD
MKNALALALAAALLAGCAGEPRREGALDPRMVEKLSAVTLDPAEAGRILNAYRAGHGLGPLRPDPRLMAMAQRQADAMVKANALSHDAGGAFAQRVQAAGIDSAHVAENLGGGYFSTAEAFEGWRRSPGHDANLRLKNATRYGIALSKDPRTSYRAWWVLVVAAEPEIRQEMAAEGAGPIVRFGNNARPAR